MSWTALILKDVGSQHLPWCRSHTWRSSGSHSVLSTSQRMQRTDARDWGKFGYVWILKKGLILGNSNQVTLQNLMTSIAMFMENWMKPCSISVQCWLWAALQGVFAFRVFEFKREHWNKFPFTDSTRAIKPHTVGCVDGFTKILCMIGVIACCAELVS